MSLWLERKYSSLLAAYLHKFKQKTPSLYTFRCPYCNDSQKNENKTRGYLYEKTGKLKFKCHNCGMTSNFSGFLKYVNPQLYNQYSVEKFYASSTSQYNKETNNEQEYDDNIGLVFETPEKSFKNFCVNSTKLNDDHHMIQYMQSRKIPKEKYNEIFYCEDIKNFEEIYPAYKDRLMHEDRLVIPVKNRQSKYVAFMTRTLGKSKLRYINIKKDENESIFYNIDKINFNETCYVVEGGIDSLFLPNCCALAGTGFNKLEGIFPKKNTILILDNQPRNREVIKGYYNAADAGWKICVWPNYLLSKGKDINAMILKGMTPDSIKNIILENSFDDLTLKMKIFEWSKLKI